MKLLRELPPSSPLIERAKQLIEAAPPIPDSLERMARVRRALDGPERARRHLPAMALAGGALLFGATAFGAAGLWLIDSDVNPDAHTAGAADRAPRSRSAAAAPQPRAADHEPRQPPASRARDAEPAALAAAEPSRRQAGPGSGRTARASRSNAREPADDTAHTRGEKRAHHRSRRTRGEVAADRASLGSRLVAAEFAREEAPVPARGPGAVKLTALEDARDGATREGSAHAARRDAATADQAERVSRPIENARVPEPGAAPRPRGSDSELVLRAVQVLRRERDPARALALLVAHRAKHPTGPLAEEVLALQIEAASASKDARARMFAREYLTRYPDGRYESVARTALEGANR